MSRCRFLRGVVVAGVGLGLLGAGEAGAQEAGPAAVAVPGWRLVEPAGETGCAFDTPFRFFFREGADPSRLLIYFQGGGACWESVSCSGMFDSGVSRDEVSEYGGIFDFDDPANPFRDYGVVFIPYCTGDVHVGDAVRAYGAAGEASAVHHRGYRNVTAALEWAEERLVAPERVVVAGTSAGAYGALFYTPRVAAMFPSSHLVFIGDSGVPLLPGYPRILDAWGASRVLGELWGVGRALDAGDMTLENAHRHAAAAHPAPILVQITSDRDAIQSAFYMIAGSYEWREDTYRLLDDLERSLPRFRSFVVSGADHGLLPTDRFLRYEARGVRLSDWLRRIEELDLADSRRCAACGVR